MRGMSSGRTRSMVASAMWEPEKLTLGPVERADKIVPGGDIPVLELVDLLIVVLFGRRRLRAAGNFRFERLFFHFLEFFRRAAAPMGLAAPGLFFVARARGRTFGH